MLSRHPDDAPTCCEVDVAARQDWMRVLAAAPRAELERLWEVHGGKTLKALRPTETGLVMVRGRAGGTGRRFNLGEMTVTRAAVGDMAGRVGHGYVRGRDKRHAELAASFDALLQDPQRQGDLLARVIAPLAAVAAARRAQIRDKAAATRVDFFTMARGE